VHQGGPLTAPGRILGRAAVLAVAVALLLSPPALAGRHYGGAIAGDDATTISIKLKKREGRWWLTAFVARSFIISCESDVQARLGSAAVRAPTGAIPITKKGRFHARVERGPKLVELDGKLDGPVSASGTVRYSGLTTVMVGEQEQTLDCDSGPLHWQASRTD
jgi:hypothetical protein